MEGSSLAIPRLFVRGSVLDPPEPLAHAGLSSLSIDLNSPLLVPSTSMSKDQLGWDQILNKKDESEAASEAGSERSSEQLSQAAEKTSAPAEPKEKKSSKKPRSKKTKQEEPSELYAKKDWSKLEFPASGNAVTQSEGSVEVTKSEGAVEIDAKKTSTTVAIPRDSETVKVTTTSTIVQSKTVSIPVVRSPAQVPYEPSRSSSVVAEDAEPAVISVSELNRHIKSLLEGTFPMLWLKGEISNFKAHTSGHFYFSLKDSKAQISAVMFRGFNSQLRFRPEDGMEVIVRGKVTVFEPRGNYQIFCETMEPVGAGALQKAFEQLKAKLQKEGLFDEAKKRPLPSLPKHVAIVTSPTGAAIRDMLNVLGRRFKGLHITVIPCKVQGEAAPGEIVKAIALANQLKDVDVMIVGRGGGSIEDLWAFNDERVARAIAAAKVPVISAVGHEIDFTIADFVADLRAPTPSAAAELVVKNASDVAERVKSLSRSMMLNLSRRLFALKDQVGHISKRLIDPRRRIQDASLRSDELLQRLELAIVRSIDTRKPVLSSLEARLKSETRNALTRKREVLQKNMAVLDSLSPLKVLDRGFSMVMVGEKIITDAESLKPGDEVRVRMCQGAIDATVTKIETNTKIKKN